MHAKWIIALTALAATAHASVLPRQENTCAAGETQCTSANSGVKWCANLQTSSFDCGACGQLCVGGFMDCINGKCPEDSASGYCAPGLSACQGGPTAVAPLTCEDLKSSPNHCGACYVKCPAGTVCENRICKAAPSSSPPPVSTPGPSPSAKRCDSYQLACDNRCVNPANDNQHCGACGVTCRSGSNCVNGSCTPINGCGGGQERCADGCKNLLNDNNNCGSCERKCKERQNCWNGKCS